MLLLSFNILYIAGFTLYYISIKNYEFLLYIFIMIFFFLFLLFTYHKTKFSIPLLWALSTWGLLHMIGGGLRYKGGVMYTFKLIPLWVTENFYVLKYDQALHAYVYFIMIFVLWTLLRKHFTQASSFTISLVLLLMSVGVGAFNEIAEFIAVLALPKTGVGGYYNTAWDIVFNTMGALLGVFVLHFWRKRKTIHH